MPAKPETSQPSMPREPPDRCPGCQGGPLFEVGGDGPNFLCRNCNRCWHVGETIDLVNPLTCRGCEWRPQCLSRFDCVLEPGGHWPHLEVAAREGEARQMGSI